MLSETHFYDGKLERTKEEIREMLDRAQNVPFEDKQEAFHHFKWELEERCSSEEWHALHRLIDEQEMYYDPINKLHVDWLLWLCYEKIMIENNRIFEEHFKQQLQDMGSSGFCIQGRSVRLLQILVAFG